MKICLISTEYPPFVGGGIGTYAEGAARKLAEAGHQVDVITNHASHGATAPELVDPRWQSGNLTIHRLDLYDDQWNPPDPPIFLGENPHDYTFQIRQTAGDLSNYAAIQIAEFALKLHAEREFDVIEAPDTFCEVFYISRRRRAGRYRDYPPICLMAHGASRACWTFAKDTSNLGQFWLRSRARREEDVLRNADAMQCPSQLLIDYYESLPNMRLPKLQAIVPYYFDPPTELAELPPELKNERYVLLVGRVEPRKGTDIALRAFARLASEFPDLRLALVGVCARWVGQETFDDLLARELPRDQHDRVLRIGRLSRAEVLAAQKSAAVVIHPARWETFPNSILEAMAMGAPCVVSDVGGQVDMIEHERSGLIVTADDDTEFANALRRILADKELTERFRVAAPVRVRELTDEQSIHTAKISLFESMIAQDKEDAAAMDACPLPGTGMVVVDAASAPEDAVRSTLDGLAVELREIPGWECGVIDIDREPRVPLPDGWSYHRLAGAAPWIDLDPQSLVVYIRAGVRLDPGGVRALALTLANTPEAAGSFSWLRVASAPTWPYRHDLSLMDFMIAGPALLLAFALRVKDLSDCDDFAGLADAEGRLCALPALALARHDGLLLHTGDTIGEWPDAIPSISIEARARMIGALELHGLAPTGVSLFGQLDIDDPASLPTIPLSDLGSEGVSEPRPQHSPSTRKKRHPIPAGTPVITRIVKKLRLGDLARRALPKPIVRFLARFVP